MRLLILGGTAEAIALADATHDLGHHVTTALAGRTQNPRLPKGKIFADGFGGGEGLATYLRKQKIDYLIDATHPFAVNMSANAVAAAEEEHVPLVRLERPVFQPRKPKEWWEVANIEEAAARLPAGAVALLTVGRQQIEPFLEQSDVRFVLRSIEAPGIELPANITAIQGRPPFSRADELSLMKREGITHLVAKNSGGEMTAHKLEAAYMLKIQVIMVQRPELPDCATAASVADVLELLAHLPAPRRRFFFLP